MMLPYGTLHHAYIHARWSLPMVARASAPRTAHALDRMRRALTQRPARRHAATLRRGRR